MTRVDDFLTIILLVNDGDSRPVEESDEVFDSWVKMVLRWVEVDGELPMALVQVETGFNVGQVQSFAQALHMGSQNWLPRPEHALKSDFHLAASWKKITTWFIII